jgi:hypothetical protein
MRYLALIFVFVLQACGAGNSGKTSDASWPKWSKIPPDINWSWQLQGDLKIIDGVKLYDIDLFDTNTSTIDKLRQKGAKVICYFSAGSFESWRSDADKFPDSIKGKKMDGWDESWLDIRSDALKSIIKSRLDLAKSKNCDGVEPDNVDGYSNDTGFDLSLSDQLRFNKFLSNEAHHRGLAIGLKNDLDQIQELEPFFDFALNEQCHEYHECNLLAPFAVHHKAILNAEYAEKYKNNTNGARDKMCQESLAAGTKTLILPLGLDGSFRIACP